MGTCAVKATDKFRCPNLPAVFSVLKLFLCIALVAWVRPEWWEFRLPNLGLAVILSPVTLIRDSRACTTRMIWRISL